MPASRNKKNHKVAERFGHSIVKDGKTFLLLEGCKLVEGEGEEDKIRLTERVKAKFGINIINGPAVERGERDQIIFLPDPSIFGIYVEQSQSEFAAALYESGFVKLQVKHL